LPLTDHQQVRKEGNLPDESRIQSEKLEVHIETASLEMKELLGKDSYSAYEEKSSDDEDKKVLSKAEALLTLYYAVPVFNIETQGTGIVRSKGWDESRSEMISWNEASQLAEMFRDRAMKLIQPYLPQKENPQSDDIKWGAI